MPLSQYQSAPLLAPFTLADFQLDPGYRFLLQQGQQAIDNAAAAAGRYESGPTLKELDKYQQGQAAQQYDTAQQQYVNQQGAIRNALANLSGQGQQAAGQQGQFAASGANQLANILQGGGTQLAGLQTGLGTNLSNVYGTAGQNIAGMQQSEGTGLSNLGQNAATQVAGYQQGLGTGLSNLGQTAANQVMGLQSNLGTNLGNLYQNTGQVVGADTIAAALQQAGIDANTARLIASEIAQSANIQSWATTQGANSQNQMISQLLGGGGSALGGGAGAAGSSPLGNLGSAAVSLLKNIPGIQNLLGGGGAAAGSAVDAFGNPALPFDQWNPETGLSDFFPAASTPAAAAGADASLAALGPYAPAQGLSDIFGMPAATEVPATGTGTAAGAGLLSAAGLPLALPLGFLGIAGLLSKLMPSNQDQNVIDSLSQYRQQLAAAGVPQSLIDSMGTGSGGVDATGAAWYALTPEGRQEYDRQANIIKSQPNSQAAAAARGNIEGVGLPNNSNNRRVFESQLAAVGIPQATLDSLDDTLLQSLWTGITPQGRQAYQAMKQGGGYVVPEGAAGQYPASDETPSATFSAMTGQKHAELRDTYTALLDSFGLDY
jgi:hypothetical protein